MWSHTNKNKHNKSNWFSEHFRQKWSFQNASISEHQDFQIFWGSMPPGSPVACTHSSRVTRQWFKNVPILCTQKVGQSVIYLWKGSQVPSVIGILCFVVRIFIAGLDK